MFKTIARLAVGAAIAVFSISVASAVRYNQYTGYWEGNVCMTPWGWAYVPFQPIGTYCIIPTPNGPLTGMIVDDIQQQQLRR